MVYENLYSDFVSLFPQYKSIIDLLATDANADEDDGMHIMFSFVIEPFIIILVNENDIENIRKAFNFFEEMASSKDVSITEVLEFSVIEKILSDDMNIVNKCTSFMGEETRKSVQRISRYMNINE